MLQLDYLEVIRKEDRKIPYTSNDVRNYLKHSIVLNYGSVTDIAPDMKSDLPQRGPHPRVGDRALPPR